MCVLCITPFPAIIIDIEHVAHKVILSSDCLPSAFLTLSAPEMWRLRSLGGSTLLRRGGKRGGFPAHHTIQFPATAQFPWSPTIQHSHAQGPTPIRKDYQLGVTLRVGGSPDPKRRPSSWTRAGKGSVRVAIRGPRKDSVYIIGKAVFQKGWGEMLDTMDKAQAKVFEGITIDGFGAPAPPARSCAREGMGGQSTGSIFTKPMCQHSASSSYALISLIFMCYTFA